MLFGLGEVGRQGAVAGGHLLAAGGQGGVELFGVDLGVALQDLVAQVGLDHEIHVVEQVDGQALAPDDSFVQLGILGRAIDHDLMAFPRQGRALVAQKHVQGLVVAALNDGA